jgi:predicted secreted protein with PEFG-CTERM motif
MPIPRHGLDAVTINENIYLIGGGTAPGASYSPIIEKYHNTVIPEFGILVLMIFAMSVAMTILVTKSKFQNNLQL